MCAWYCVRVLRTASCPAKISASDAERVLGAHRPPHWPWCCARLAAPRKSLPAMQGGFLVRIDHLIGLGIDRRGDVHQAIFRIDPAIHHERFATIEDVLGIDFLLQQYQA